MVQKGGGFILMCYMFWKAGGLRQDKRQKAKGKRKKGKKVGRLKGGKVEEIEAKKKPLRRCVFVWE